MLRAKGRAYQSTPLFDPLGNFISFSTPTQVDSGLWKHVDAAVTDFAAKLSGEIPGIYRREAPD